MVIIKITDYLVYDYSFDAFSLGADSEYSYERIGKSHLSKATTA